MVVALAVAAACLLLVLAVLALDWAAQRKRWRLGARTQRLFGKRVWRYDTRWGPVTIHGGCERCRTSWRYVDPHPIAVAPYGALAVLYPFCSRCHDETPRADRRELYASWWLERRDGIVAEGVEEPPDVREWAELEVVLRHENRVDRLVA